MSFKSKLAAGAAGFALAGGSLCTAGTLTASAATPPCGHKCVDLYNRNFGSHYFMDVYNAEAERGQAAIMRGQEVVLFQGSNGNPGEDFTYRAEGDVNSFRKAGLVSTAFAKTYGDDPAFELQWAPNGVNSGLCVGTHRGTARPDDEVVLEPCGGSASTVWAIDTADQVGNYSPLINGSSTHFSDPLVLTYPASYPTDTPRPGLTVEPLNTYSNGTVFDNQEWSAKLGPLK
jgi:hypothetical protein